MARRLALLMGLATLTLPFYHASAYGLNAMFQWTNRYLPVAVPNYDQLGTPGFYATFFIRQASAYGIPIFLFVAGFFAALMAKSGPGGTGWGAVWARIRKLLVPYVIWIAISSVVLQRIPSVGEVLSIYYFVPLVTQYYLLSPALVRWAKARGTSLLVVAALVQLGLQSLRYLDDIGVTFPGLALLLRVTPLWFFPSRIFYFVLGAVAGVHAESFHAGLQRARGWLGVIVAGSLVLMFVEHALVASAVAKPWLGPTFSGVARNVYAVAVVFWLLALEWIPLPFLKPLEWLGRRSLGVYFMNTLVIYSASSLMYHRAPWALGVPVLYQGVLVVLGLGVPLLAMWAVSRSPARKYYSAVFG